MTNPPSNTGRIRFLHEKSEASKMADIASANQNEWTVNHNKSMVHFTPQNRCYTSHPPILLHPSSFVSFLLAVAWLTQIRSCCFCCCLLLLYIELALACVRVLFVCRLQILGLANVWTAPVNLRICTSRSVCGHAINKAGIRYVSLWAQWTGTSSEQNQIQYKKLG